MKFFFITTILFLMVFLQTGSAQLGTKMLTLEDVTKGYGFYARSVTGIRPMNDGLYYTTLEEGIRVVRYDYETGTVRDTLVNLADKGELPVERFDGYEFSDDEQRILFYSNREQIYRYSFKADYYIFDVLTGRIMPLSDKGKQQLATFSPDSRNIAYYRDNNLFIKDFLTGDEKQITQDGLANSIINGAPDWVYEEEFSFSKAFAWSADGSYLAYIRFDECRVKEFSMTLFKGLKPELEEYELYPESRTWKYPKAGEDNSVVSVHVYDLRSGSTAQMDIGGETDIYIPRIKWTPDPEILCIYRLNRLQNKLEFLYAQAKTGQSAVVYADENPYYIDESNFDHLTFLGDKDRFVMVNEQSGWNHIYLYSLGDDQVMPVTHGEFDVTDLYGVHREGGKVYFQAAMDSPVSRDVFSVNLDGSGLTKLSRNEGTNRAAFSRGFQYYLISHSNSTKPTYVTLYDNNSREVRILEDNQTLTTRLQEYAFRNKELFSFITSEGISLNGWMIKPPDFDTSHSYPVLMYQYSGPGSQSVQDEWSFGWYQYLSQQGYIIACVDGRGTGGRGEAFRKSTYMQLGKCETTDQSETARYLGSLPFVDSGRIGIWGWSYGGFITLSCLTQATGLFKMGIAVAPVSHWKYYDNIYTERFMRKPADNPDGYQDNAPVSRAERMDGKLLIIHGTADDNVHVQNTMEFCEALVQADKQFDMMLYTNRNHGINGGNTRYHLYRKMTEYIIENL